MGIMLTIPDGNMRHPWIHLSVLIKSHVLVFSVVPSKLTIPEHVLETDIFSWLFFFFWKRLEQEMDSPA